MDHYSDKKELNINLKLIAKEAKYGIELTTFVAIDSSEYRWLHTNTQKTDRLKTNLFDENVKPSIRANAFVRII
jgi:hypothetical protein